MMQFWKKTRRVFVIKLTIMTLVLALLGRGVFWLCCPDILLCGFSAGSSFLLYLWTDLYLSV